MRGTRSSPIPIDDSEEEVLEELCDNSADSAIADNLSTRLMDAPSPETYASTSHKRKRDEIRTDYTDAFIQGSSSMPLSPVGESKKARKRRRRLELKALEAAEMLARAQAQQNWYGQMSNVLYGSTGGYDPNVDMTMFYGIESVPTYSTDDNTNAMRSYSQNVTSGPSEWVSAMALAGSLPDPNGYSNQYQWPPPNGRPYSHNFHTQPFVPPSRSPSPPALLERVSSPVLPTVNQLLPTAPNAHSITAKRAQIIGMKPDNEPHSKRGTFRFNPGNLSFFLHIHNQNPGHIGNLTINNQHSYIPNPACTIVMEQLPKSHRTIEFVKSWAKQSSDVMPVCILVDAPSGKALVEFPSAKFSRKAWESPRLGAEYVGLKTHQLKGKPRVDQIRVWWYRVDGVGAGAGVGEIEEGEIGDDEVDAGQDQQQRFGPQTKQKQKQGQQDLPRQPESKKARKARLAREKQAKQGKRPISPQHNHDLSGSGLGHDLTSGMTELTNASTAVILPESPISSRRSPQLLRAVNWKNLARPDLQVDMQLEEVSRSPQLRHHRSSNSFWSNANKGNAGISTPTSTDGRAETAPRHWPRDADVTVEFNSGEDSITFSKEELLTRQLRGSGDATSAHASRRASSSSVADQVTAVAQRGYVTSTCPPSPSSSSATSMILQLSEIPQSTLQGSQGTSPIDITQSITKPFSSGLNYDADAVALATSTATSTSIVTPSFRTLPKLPLSYLTRQPAPSAQPRSTVSSVSTASPLELAVKGITSAAKAVSQLNPVPVAVAPNNSTPTSQHSPIPISTPEPRAAASEQASTGVTASSGSTKLAEMKRALMAKQKDLEETIARSKLEMTRLKESASVEAKEDTSVSSLSSAEGNKAMEDRLRKLVLQSQKTRSKSTEHQRSVLPQSRSSSTSSSSVSSTIPSPPVLTPPPGGPDNLVHTMSPVQTFSLEDLAVSFITETISTLKQATTPTLVSSPIAQSPSVSLVPVVPTSRPQPRVQSQSQPQPQAQSQVPAPGLSNGQATIKEELSARQKQLEQYIAESRVLMTQLTQARTKQEKDRLLVLMREKTRLMDEEKEQMANVANGTDQATVSAARVRGSDEQKRASKPVMFIKWPTCSLDGVLIISDDEHDEDEEKD